ncbi:MAG TPA: zf-HC2 domain-containing protein [Ktedonobacteraceae bacterium]|nr:zf-HC2 domain-containing protein [Ktedonobacteraceae bacterium]
MNEHSLPRQQASHDSVQKNRLTRTGHISDLLPAYLNGRLDAHSGAEVRAHLALCQTCEAELASWQAISKATHAEEEALPLPAAHTMSRVWEKLDAMEIQQAQAPRHTLQEIAQHMWLVFTRQIPLIHKSIWIASVLVNILMLVLVFLSDPFSIHAHERSIEGVLALFTTVVAAAGIAFIYQAEKDAGYEVILSTPTSIRVMMICRMILVIGHNFLLAAITSGIIASITGGNVWDFAQLWFGPMLLLASISLSFSVMLGSAVGIAASLVIEVLQAMATSVEKVVPALQFLRDTIGQTTPWTVLAALALLAFAIYYAPRQPRLSGASSTYNQR